MRLGEVELQRFMIIIIAGRPSDPLALPAPAGRQPRDRGFKVRGLDAIKEATPHPSASSHRSWSRFGIIIHLSSSGFFSLFFCKFAIRFVFRRMSCRCGMGKITRDFRFGLCLQRKKNVHKFRHLMFYKSIFASPLKSATGTGGYFFFNFFSLHEHTPTGRYVCEFLPTFVCVAYARTHTYAAKKENSQKEQNCRLNERVRL